ncbi:hypothetical protein [Leucobacter massiliensis]|nr:hypothetical protein [Leucobacter massiliensis]
MPIPGFLSDDYDWQGAEVGAALAGLVVRDAVGVPLAGVMPSRADLVRGRSDWYYDVSPFVAVRVEGRTVLIGPSPELESVATSPAPSSNARIDIIYSRPADVGAGETVEAVFVAQGLASSVPQPPALPSGAVELARFRVSAGNTSTSAAVGTQTFQTTVCAGGVLPFRTAAQRDAFLATPGQLAMVADVLWQRTATAWKRVAPDQTITYRRELAVRSVPANSTISEPVAFPAGTFSSAPVIAIASPRSGSRGAHATVNNLTASSCTVHLHNDTSSAVNMGVYLFVSM